MVLPAIDSAIGDTFPVVKFLMYILDQLTLDLMFSLNLTAIVTVFENPVTEFLGLVKTTLGGILSIV